MIGQRPTASGLLLRHLLLGHGGQDSASHPEQVGEEGEGGVAPPTIVVPREHIESRGALGQRRDYAAPRGVPLRLAGGVILARVRQDHAPAATVRGAVGELTDVDRGLLRELVLWAAPPVAVEFLVVRTLIGRAEVAGTDGGGVLARHGSGFRPWPKIVLQRQAGIFCGLLASFQMGTRLQRKMLIMPQNGFKRTELKPSFQIRHFT